MELATAPNLQAVTEFVSQDLCMWSEFVTRLMTQTAISTTRAFATAGSALNHGGSLSVAAFPVRSNIWAALFCSKPRSLLLLSRKRAGRACAALFAEGSIILTGAHTWLMVACVLINAVQHARLLWRPEPTVQAARFPQCVAFVWHILLGFA